MAALTYDEIKALFANAAATDEFIDGLQRVKNTLETDRTEASKRISDARTAHAAPSEADFRIFSECGLAISILEDAAFLYRVGIRGEELTYKLRWAEQVLKAIRST